MFRWQNQVPFRLISCINDISAHQICSTSHSRQTTVQQLWLTGIAAVSHKHGMVHLLPELTCLLVCLAININTCYWQTQTMFGNKSGITKSLRQNVDSWFDRKFSDWVTRMLTVVSLTRFIWAVLSVKYDDNVTKRCINKNKNKKKTTTKTQQ